MPDEGEFDSIPQAKSILDQVADTVENQQLASGILQTANIMSQYYTALRQQGFNDDQAMYLVESYQTLIVGHGLKY